MRLTWILLLLTCGLILVSRLWAFPSDEIKINDDVEPVATSKTEEPNSPDTPDEPGRPENPKPQPIPPKHFPDVFNIEQLDDDGQVGFSVGAEFVANNQSLFSEEVYLKHKRGGKDETQDYMVYRSKIRLRQKDSDETVILLETQPNDTTKGRQEIFQIHNGKCSSEDTEVFKRMDAFFPDLFGMQINEIRTEWQNKGFYLGPAAAIFQLGNKWANDPNGPQIRYSGKFRGDDITIPKDDHQHDGEKEKSSEFSEKSFDDEDDGGDYGSGVKNPFVGLKELNTWKGEILITSSTKVTVIFRFSLDSGEDVSRHLIPVPISFEVIYPPKTPKKEPKEEPKKQSFFFTSFKHYRSRKNEKLPEIGIPIGLGCNRNANKIVDRLPKETPPHFMDSDFDVEMEIVASSCADKHLESCTESIFNAKMHHLKEYNMVSVDQTVLSMSGKTTRQQVKNIIDYNEMLRYEVKAAKDTCQTFPVSNDFEKWYEDDKPEGTERMWHYVPSLDIVNGLGKLKLFQPRFFALDESDSFIGYNLIRDVNVLTYEGEYDHQYVVGGRAFKVRVTKHFINDDLTSREGAILTNNAPTEIVFRVLNPEAPDSDASITVNIHKFKVGVIDREVIQNAFDVESCFKGPMQSTWFEMVFPLQEKLSEQLLNHEKAIESSFRSALGELPPNRLPVVIVEKTNDFILVSAQLLDRPEDIFDKVPNEQILHGKDNKDANAQNSMLIESGQLCERKCLDSEVDVEKAICTSFSFCANLECDLHFTNNEKQNPAEFKVADKCWTYKKKPNVPNNIMDERGMSLSKHTIPGVLNLIDKMIQNKELKITVDRKNNDNTATSQELEASLLVRNVDPGFIANKRIKKKNDKEDNLSTLLEGYVVHERNMEFAYSDEALDKFKFTRLAGLEPQACARFCDDDDACKSFSICTDPTQNCILAPVDYQDITESMLDSPRFACTVLAKTFLYDYDKMEKMKLNNKAKAVVKVSSPEACAKDCSGRSDFECRSFDFCRGLDDKTECLLHESHVLHTNEDEQKIDLDLMTTTCDHFSRAYTRDFTMQNFKKFTDKVSIAMEKKEVSSEECAKECADDEDNDCYHYEFCETLTESGKKPNRVCRFGKGSAVPSVEEDKHCKSYSIKTKALRANKPVKPPPPKSGKPEPEKTKEPKGVSPVVTAFFALFFVALATIGGVFGFRYFQTWRANRTTAAS